MRGISLSVELGVAISAAQFMSFMADSIGQVLALGGPAKMCRSNARWIADE